MRNSLKYLLIPTLAALVAGSAAALAVDDRFAAAEADPGAPPPPRSLYERIYAHYGHLGRDVREEFRDGPCKIERHWERDGDFKETIRCRGPRN
jgi:hypothetical protein